MKKKKNQKQKTPINKYFDNAATSFPKPDEVANEIARYLNKVGGPYGRSFYERAVEVGRTVEDARELVAGLLGTKLTAHVVFSPNATNSTNTILKGLLRRNDEVWISPLEHNAVCRPLNELETKLNIKIKILPSFDDGLIDVKNIKKQIKELPALVIINHQSNVNGVIQPIAEIKKTLGTDVPVLIDCAQSLGFMKLNVDNNGFDYVSLTHIKIPPDVCASDKIILLSKLQLS